MRRFSNQVTDAQLDAMKRRGWIERSRQARPREARILVTLWHPRQTIGEGSDRYRTAVETFRSLPLDDLSPADIGAAARHVAHPLPATTSHR